MSLDKLKSWNCHPRKNNNNDDSEEWTCVENTKETFENVEEKSNFFQKIKTNLFGNDEYSDYYFYGSIILIVIFLILLIK
jgi:hypothetical protein